MKYRKIKRLCIGAQNGDAMEMCRLLTTRKQRDRALAELRDGDVSHAPK